jgi:hypothetical protein
MPYVTRNKKGEIKAIHATPPPNSKVEWVVPEQMVEVIGFLNASQSAEHSYAFMDSSDIELIRVLEDLIDLLCEKHIIAFTELPETAQQKLGMRKQVRKNMEGFASLIDEDEKGIF